MHDISSYFIFFANNFTSAPNFLLYLRLNSKITFFYHYIYLDSPENCKYENRSVFTIMA